MTCQVELDASACRFIDIGMPLPPLGLNYIWLLFILPALSALPEGGKNAFDEMSPYRRD